MSTAPGTRLDGRAAAQLRGVAVAPSILRTADGAVRLRCGRTVVVAAASGPTEPRMRRDALSDRASLSVAVVPPAGAVDPRHAAIARAVEDLLASSAVLAHMHPHTAIGVVVHVLCDDGSLFAAVTNAALLALVDAGIPLRAMPIAIDCCLVSSSSSPTDIELVNNEITSTDDGMLLLVDPTADEEKVARAQLSFVFLPHATIILSPTNDKNDSSTTAEPAKVDAKPQLIALHAEGAVTSDVIQRCHSYCEKLSVTLLNLFRDATRIKVLADSA